MQPSDLQDLVGSKRAVIFDLFHTLTGLESKWGAGLPETHEILGIDKAVWDQQVVSTLSARLRGEQTDPFSIIAGLARPLNPALPDAKIRAATERRMARFAAALTQIPQESLEVPAILRNRGKRIGLISNADAMEVAAWAECPLARSFDSVVFSCHVGWMKPEAEIYLHCLRELEATPAECIFVGDGGSNELEGARNLGITTVMMTGIIKEVWPERIARRAKHADFTISRLSELVQ